jgi:ABC-type branched-subunit amino acid transport system ATPase component
MTKKLDLSNLEERIENLLLLYLDQFDELKPYHHDLIDKVYDVFPRLKKKYGDRLKRK